MSEHDDFNDSSYDQMITDTQCHYHSKTNRELDDMQELDKNRVNDTDNRIIAQNEQIAK